MDRREGILIKCDEEAGGDGLVFDGNGNIIFYDGKVQPIYNAMDENAKQMCLEFIEFVTHETTGHSYNKTKDELEFKYKGEWISKEKLFENFL